MGHTAPYRAVIALSEVAAYHWRRVRSDLALAGMEDPMKLPTMHNLLDLIERMILESMQGSKNPKEDEAKREAFLDKLYRPDPVEVAEAPNGGYKPPPSGFDEEDVESAFDAFTMVAGGAE